MGPEAENAQEAAWRSAVIVREDPGLATELLRRWDASAPLRSVSVTDLLAPRRAYWRLRLGPVALPPERKARLEAGRRVHRVLERLLSPEAAIEVRVRREGIVGRIDALTDRPIEFKTTSSLPSTGRLANDRPEYVEQLGMYCALAQRPDGRLIAVAEGGSSPPDLRSWDVRFRDLDAVSREMGRRATALRGALASDRPSGLPRCPWFDRGCEYHELGTCDCSGDEPEEGHDLSSHLAEVAERPETERLLTSRLDEALRSTPVPRVARFRELVYPRRAYYERKHPEEEVEPAGHERALPPPSPAYERLLDSVEGGPVGEVARLPTLSEEPEEEVPAFRGVPYLARTSRAFVRPRAEDVVDLAPQYPLELGFRCATTGTHIGRVILAYENASTPDERLKVFEFHFDPITTFSRLWRRRASQLESALASGTPEDLSACPAWMFSRCPYRGECGCGPVPGRSQR